MAEDDRRDRDKDMVLAPNEYMYVQDETKGHVDVFLGPTKQSLSNSDKPVIFDDKAKRFIKCDDYRRATQVLRAAPEGWYIVLKNPAKDGKHPTGQGKVSAGDLEIGRKINIPGPCNFALYPGQMAKTIKGHHLRSNQYLLVRVYDADAARKNWKNQRVERAGTSGEGTEQVKTAEKDPDFTVLAADELTMGQLLVIKGTDVSFYIPPTGIEVVPDESNALVRNAVTLARLEFCLLLDESGNKRYEQGPAVVFPEPTEVFVEREAEDKDGAKIKTRKFRAIELNENSGIYLKVIADYKDEVTGKEYKTGEELFVTGKETMIYFPREEHAIVKYGSSEVHYGIAIPPGEARYVLNRNNGEIKKVAGPTVFLPDPRSEVIVRRILDYKTCNLLYPNNIAAFQHNAGLLGIDLETYMTEHPQSVANVGLAAAAFAGALGATGPQGPMGSRGFAGPAGAAYGGAAYTVVTSNAAFGTPIGDSLEARGLANAPGRGMVGDQFQRKNQFTAPRSITLDSKFDGVPEVQIWEGYAMLLVRKSGERKVVQGPKTVLLEYDEYPQALSLSTGKPKTTDNLVRTAYLKTDSNVVSDLVEVETSDYCKLTLKVAYRVKYEGDQDIWFKVENYVKFLCDHMRSKIRNAVKKETIEKFYAGHTDILRDIVLGKAVELRKDEPGEGTKRPGTVFKENGMRIYDVEVLDVVMKNQEIEKMLIQAQRGAFEGTLGLANKRREFENSKELETLKQQMEELQSRTRLQKMQLESHEAEKKLERDLVIIDADVKAAAERHTQQLANAKSTAEIAQVDIDLRTKTKQTEIALEKEAQQTKLEMVRAEVQAVVDKAKAVDPNLVAALNAFGERAMIEKVSEAMAPLAMIKQSGVMDVLGELLKGTKFAEHIAQIPKNGTPSQARA